MPQTAIPYLPYFGSTERFSFVYEKPDFFGTFPQNKKLLRINFYAHWGRVREAPSPKNRVTSISETKKIRPKNGFWYHRSGCSIAVFTIELIHHGWIPFLFSVSSIVARLQLRTTWLDMVCNLGFWRCIQTELHYIRIKCLWCGMEAPRIRKGKSSDNLPTHYSTATIGVFWGHGLYDPTDPPIHR
ncbi:hypothetical protein LOTGIDRAFT_175715 [Lottia gigantea]|uniref:Uncharacterized protein n=1 Tax=Lottia gigantea TaxID=225164 RepID=V4AFV4_LOTGI|nr:hypothetical protein LOTGIDRAFT_175715 [Lottia gigantea]ESO92281.1 hypothetical protein LOTGIDRAFT_175715 [Lottia gigantea]